MRINRSDIFNYPAIILLCIQFFLGKIAICTAIDNTGLKHIFMILAVVYGFFPAIQRGIIYLKKYTYEIKRIFFTVSLLIVITIIYMLVNGFATYWIGQTYFFVAPILFVYVLFVNYGSAKRFRDIFDIFTYVLSFFYAIYIIQKILSGSGLQFSFVESESPFEMEIAHMYLLLYMFYTYIGKKRERILTFICCVLAWKRMCLVYLILFTILNYFIPKAKCVTKKYYITITVLFALIPSLIQLMMTEAFSTWFNETFGIDLVDFMQFRFQSITTAFQSDIASQGLGSFLYVDVPWYDGFVHMNIHNDIVRIYLELSIVGLVVFLYGFSSIAKNVYSFLVIVYMFIELAVSHFLGNGSIPFWVLAYALIFFFNYDDTKYKSIKTLDTIDPPLSLSLYRTEDNDFE